MPGFKRPALTERNVVLALAVITVLAGVLLRYLMLLERPSLWGDEGNWYYNIVNREQGYFSLRAPLYTWVNEMLFTQVFDSLTEWKIRFLSIVSGTLFVPLFAYGVHRIYRDPYLTLFAAAAAAFNTLLISYTHEFKPYAVDLFLHGLWYVLLFHRPVTRASLVLATGTLLVGSLFSYSLVIVFPAHLLMLLWLRMKRELPWRPLLGNAGMVLLGLGFFLYVRANFIEPNSGFWANKYDVFYTGNLFSEAFLVWFFEKIPTTFTMALNLYPWVQRPPTVGETAVLLRLMHSAGVGIALSVVLLAYAWLCRKDLRQLMPAVIFGGFVLAGLLHIWPLGFFRTNVFLFFYSTLLLIEVLRLVRSRAVILLFAAVPLAVCSVSNPTTKAFAFNQGRKAVELFCTVADPADRVFLVGSNMRAGVYWYFRNDGEILELCGPDTKPSGFITMKAMKRRIAEVYAENPAADIWIAVHGSSKLSRKDSYEYLKETYDLRYDDDGDGSYLVRIRPKAAPQ